MKRLVLICLFFLVIYSVYHDLSVGTLSTQKKEAVAVSSMENNDQQQAKKVKISSGQTVLSVVEQLNQKASVPIKKIVKDFKSLNPGVNPNEIQSGEIYAFPLYEKSMQ